MDAFARLEPVARSLLATTDAALQGLGAPPAHPVWDLVRRLGMTPAAAVAFFAAADPDSLRVAGAGVRDRARRYAAITVPTQVAWQGAAGEEYAAHAANLAAYLVDGAGSLHGRAAATAAYLDDVAGWVVASREGLARTLAEVLVSTQAVTLRSSPLLASPARQSEQATAAADIGAHVLRTVAGARADGQEILTRWRPQLTEAVFAPPGTVNVHRSVATDVQL